MRFHPQWSWNRLRYAIRHPYRYRVLMRYLKAEPPPPLGWSYPDYRLQIYGDIALAHQRQMDSQIWVGTTDA